jgi:5-methyltetrahydropteroyltriglutamate--homocysteine methyltransferase
MVRSAVLGLPRIGPDRELKFALEAFWAGRSGREELLDVGAGLRWAGWQRARAAGIDVIPCGDFSLYDHVLDTAWGLGVIPARFGELDRDGLDGYFALARGTADQGPLEMTKWFDTNYHYLVPELETGRRYELNAAHWTDPLREAAAVGVTARPVVLGPFSFLLLAKGLAQPLDELDGLVAVYAQLLSELAAAGAREVQIDEPCLVLDRTSAELDAFTATWQALASSTELELCLVTYFAGLPTETLGRIAALAPAELHLDLVCGAPQLRPALDAVRDNATRLSLGLVNGRNVWRADLDVALDCIERARTMLGDERIVIAPSCSLLHVPWEAARESTIDPEVRSWLAFCTEKLDELSVLAQAADADSARRDELLRDARAALGSHRASAHTNDTRVRERVDALTPGDYERDSPADVRHERQRTRFALPELPTTTIGSFPQTGEIRAARHDLRAGLLAAEGYERFLEREIAHVVAVQERLGLDVLVHGEPERNDMVEYFGAQLSGFAFSQYGWVQSYGSRCVKPPILYGDVSRPAAMTVRWWGYAQSLTEKPMKGMLTGPVTILQWSFVRDDQPHQETCTQIALAIQDEVRDLQAAGCGVIQVDEAALREGLPLPREAQEDYLRWAVDCFRLTVAPAAADTQIHTHMCYSEFNEIMEHIVRLDADILSIEASRSHMDVLDAFSGELHYPTGIGPGVYDIHSPRVPSTDEISDLLELAEQRMGREQLWVNPDCGLKTRRWEDVLPALECMIAAAHQRRKVGVVPTPTGGPL